MSLKRPSAEGEPIQVGLGEEFRPAEQLWQLWFGYGRFNLLPGIAARFVLATDQFSQIPFLAILDPKRSPVGKTRNVWGLRFEADKSQLLEQSLISAKPGSERGWSNF